ncbi:MAG: hypothetical protein ACKOXB_11425 [Flavobacteriales bacterium]
MKKITAVLIFCFISALSFAQIGLGLGNGGLNIKSDHSKNLGLIGRFGLGIGSNSSFTVSPSISGIMRVFTSDNAKPYFGIGLGTSFTHTSTANYTSYNTFIPVGAEVFPMGNKRISFTVESGVGMTAFNNSFFYSGFRGLLEFTFYIGKME